MRLANVTGKKVEEYLERSQTVLIPVGSIENHGRHMALGTDTLIPDRIVEHASDDRPCDLRRPAVQLRQP